MTQSQAAIDLAEALHQYAIASGHSICTVLIDPVLRDPLDDPRWARWGAEIAARSTPVRLPSLDVDTSAWPRLVTLDLSRPRDADINRAAAQMALDDWQPDALRQGRGHRIGAWLFGPVAPAMLARHLSGVLLQAHPQGGRALLRVQDPGVFDVLWGQMRPAQHAALLGLVRQWIYIDRWQRTVVASVEATARDSSMGLVLGTDQWSRLDTIGALNRAWRRLPADHGVDAQALHAVLAALGRAIAHGMTDERDWDAYAWRAFTVDPEFDRHPDISSLLHGRAPDTGFARLVADVSDAQWDVIRSDCRRGLTPRALARNAS